MPRKKATPKPLGEIALAHTRSVSLKELAEHVGLSPTTLSLVLNNSPAASSIPQVTKQRIFAAANHLNYRPHFLARSLRTQKSHTVGVLVPEISGGYIAEVMNGIEENLSQAGYFYMVANHRHRPDLLEHYPRLFLDRCVDGVIAVDTPCRNIPEVPVVSVSGHDDLPGLTNVIIDHQKAARIALEYLVALGHSRIAIIKGQEFTSDTNVRWEAVAEAACRLNLTISPGLVSQLEGDSPSPQIGYFAGKRLLDAGEPFTALFAFNDVSAIGAIRAFTDAGYRVPDDISVIGFDDVDSARFHNPALTTIRQPLRHMGQLAASTLLERITAGPEAQFPKLLIVEPELVVRQSTATCSNTHGGEQPTSAIDRR
jgi:LacI family transcriptional regulator